MPAGETYPEHHPLDLPFGLDDRLTGVGRTHSRSHSRGVGGRMLDVPPADAADMRVRSRPCTPPIAACPVEKVVPAPTCLRPRPVGHLVPAESGRAKDLLSHQVTVGKDVLVGHRKLAAADPGCEPGPLLDDE